MKDTEDMKGEGGWPRPGKASTHRRRQDLRRHKEEPKRERTARHCSPHGTSRATVGNQAEVKEAANQTCGKQGTATETVIKPTRPSGEDSSNKTK